MRFDAPAAPGHVITTRSDGGHVLDDAREEMKRRNGTSAARPSSTPPAEAPREDKDETPIARARREMIERNEKRFAVDGPHPKTSFEKEMIRRQNDPDYARAVATAERAIPEDVNDTTRVLAEAIKSHVSQGDARAEMIRRQNDRFAVK